MSKTLYLFPDTNVFIQCRALAELDWRQFEHFAEVDLIVCRSVQREIDGQKYRGNDRVGRSARTINALFGQLAEGSASSILIHQNKPVVRLSLMGPGKPDSEASELLDYTKADDELVGHAVRFQKDQPSHEVGVLTHDSGVKVTARNLGLKIYPIHPSWLLKPEPNRHERENQQLKQRIVQLERAEPRFSIRCFDSGDVETDSMVFERLWYEPLTKIEVEVLVDELREKFPMETDFGSAQASIKFRPSLLQNALDSTLEYVPASEEAIGEYRHREYPQWIDACREFFAQLHEELQRRDSGTAFVFDVCNDGTRPGTSVLVVIECKGEISIRIPPTDEDSDRADDESLSTRLPLPPIPPSGKWKGRQSRYFTSGNAILSNLRGPRSYTLPILPAMGPSSGRDPEQFYYKPSRPEGPVKQLNLECELWRHGLGHESFEGEIVLESTARTASGILECTVHADNLSSPEKKTVKVKVVAKSVGAMNEARELVRQLVDGTSV